MSLVHNKTTTDSTEQYPKMHALLGFLFPILLALAAFVLSLLASLAGVKAGFLPDSNIALLDTSRMGLDAVLVGNNAPSIVRRSLGMGSGKTNNENNKLINGTNDEVAKAIKDAVGLDQFYAVHAWTICSGTFVNKNDPSGGLDVRVCWPLYQINLTDLLEMDLKLSGPVRGAIREVGAAAPRIPRVIGDLFTTAYLLCIFSVLPSVIAAHFTLPRGPGGGYHRPPFWTHVLNLAAAGLAFVMLVAASAVATAGANRIARAVRDEAVWLGMRVEAGARFQGMAWTATALMGVASLYHVLAGFLTSRNRSSKSRV